jgi:hypothetical protein
MSRRREQNREAARECIRIAEITSDLTLRKVLRQHAQEWLKLAYSEQDHRFRDVLADFNAEQLMTGDHLHRQAEQQQQAGTKKPPPR